MFQDILKAVAGKAGQALLKEIDAEKFVRDFVTRSTAKAVKPLIADFLTNHASDAAKAKVGRLLVMAGNALQKSDEEAAAGHLSRVVEEIKFDIPGL